MDKEIFYKIFLRVRVSYDLAIRSSLTFELHLVERWHGTNVDSLYINIQLWVIFLLFVLWTDRLAIFQGQALAKINIGDVLDSDGNYAGALNAFKEGYE